MSAPAIRIPWELSIERRWAAESLAAAAGARVTGDSGPELELDRDDLDLTFRHLARVEEGPSAKTDEHGRFPGSSSSLRRGEAPVDALLPKVADDAPQDRRRACAALARWRALLRRADARHRHAVALDAAGPARRREPPQARGRRSASARCAASTPRGLARVPLHKVRRSDPNWCFERVASLEARHGFASTSYVLAAHRDPHDGAAPEAYAARRPRLVQELSLLGGEVGLHGSYRSGDDEGVLRAEKHDLEVLLGRPVRGLRFHYLRMRWHDVVGRLDRVGHRVRHDARLLRSPGPARRLLVPLPAVGSRDGQARELPRAAAAPDGRHARGVALHEPLAFARPQGGRCGARPARGDRRRSCDPLAQRSLRPRLRTRLGRRLRAPARGHRRPAAARRERAPRCATGGRPSAARPDRQLLLPARRGRWSAASAQALPPPRRSG